MGNNIFFQGREKYFRDGCGWEIRLHIFRHKMIKPRDREEMKFLFNRLLLLFHLENVFYVFCRSGNKMAGIPFFFSSYRLNIFRKIDLKKGNFPFRSPDEGMAAAAKAYSFYDEFSLFPSFL